MRWHGLEAARRRHPGIPATAILALAVLLAATIATRADYVMPPFWLVVEESTSIVDATVVEILENKRVRIRVNEVLHGESPPLVLWNAHLSCLGTDLSRRLTVGKRYVFILHGHSVYEESSFYEVRMGAKGPECHCWDGSPSLDRRSMLVSEFARLVREAKPKEGAVR